MHYILIALVLLLALWLKWNKGAVLHIRKVFLPFLCALFILLLVIFSKTAVQSALQGLNLFLNVVLPSLFPFFVASDILQKTGVVKALGILLEPVMRPLFNIPGCGSFAFLMGITSGYPVGAKITADMLEAGLLTKDEAERLLAFSNNSGPLFIMGAVSVGMFRIPALGMLLLTCHIAACITVGFIFSFFSPKQLHSRKKSERNMLRRFAKELTAGGSNSSGLGSMIGEAVRSSVLTMLAIGGFIILFSVIIHLLIEIGFIGSLAGILEVFLRPLGIEKEIVTALLSGFFEITTGANMASRAVDAPFAHRLAAASMMIGWAGLSVHSQVLSIVGRTGLSLRPYLTGKFLQGILASAYTLLLYRTAGNHFSASLPVFFFYEAYTMAAWYDYLLASTKFLGVMLVFVLLLALVTVALNTAGFLCKNGPCRH